MASLFAFDAFAIDGSLEKLEVQAISYVYILL